MAEINEELFYRIALTRTAGIGDKTARLLLERFGSAHDIFKAPVRHLAAIEGLGMQRINALKGALDTVFIERELKFMERHCITPLFLYGKGYPERLSACPDAPVLLYFRGTADLNAAKVVSVIGTRQHTDYGQQAVEQLVGGLQLPGILVVSGLAYGIDALAHRVSLQNGISTIGVLGHGLDRIYPVRHRSLAREITGNGGLLTEYCSGTRPDKQNFPMRNRIVAGMADVTVVVETDEKGGSMITAKLASGYNREVAAFPGRSIDNKSGGCNYLIKTHMAQMITGSEDLLEMMNWNRETHSRTAQPKLFTHLTAEEQEIIQIMEKKADIHIDELLLKSGIPNAKLASSLLTMELEGFVKSLPGKRYRLS